MVAFGNPVAGIIRPPGSPLIVGNPRVTCSFDCHEARNPPTQGIDIGDGTCGKPVLAMTSGVISLIRPGKVGSTASADASIFRIKRPDGLELGVAHLRVGAGFVAGQSIVEGTQIGTVDKIGATACHVHGGCKDPSGKELDWWPLLRQNGATEEVTDMLQGTFVASVFNRKVKTVGANLRLRSSPFVRDDNIIEPMPEGTELWPAFAVKGTAIGSAGNDIWYGAWFKTAKGPFEFGYASKAFVTALEPIEQSGHTDQELAAAARKGAHAAAVDVSQAGVTAAAKYPA